MDKNKGFINVKKNDTVIIQLNVAKQSYDKSKKKIKIN